MRTNDADVRRGNLTLNKDAPLSKPIAVAPGTPVDAGSDGIAAAATDGSSEPTGDDGSITTPHGTHPRTARSGCCRAQPAPGSTILMAILVLFVALRRRRLRHSAPQP